MPFEAFGRASMAPLIDADELSVSHSTVFQQSFDQTLPRFQTSANSPFTGVN